jgi:ABC-type lipoprotein export system ATPase subunit
MHLGIDHLIPLPLKDKVNSYNSWVWGQELVLNQGEFVLIQAPSGAGKTILMHCLYGLRNDYEGMIHWGAYKMNEINATQLAGLRASSLSMVFQDLRLFPQLTVWENIDIKRRLTNAISEYESEKWLERLGLKEKMDINTANLSYGEQQRVAIVRALVQPFSWLLLDEPFSHLDGFNKQKAIKLISEVAGFTGSGVIFTDVEDNRHFIYDKKLLL